MDYRERLKESRILAAKPLKPRHGDTWGDWKYDREGLALVYRENTNDVYEVDLERCATPGEVLDWIAQITGKTWGTVECVGHLARALDDLLHLQENVVHLAPAKSFDVAGYLGKQ